MPNQYPMPDENYNSESDFRALAAKLARRKNRTAEQESVLREARRNVAAYMGLEVSPHHEHLLYERTWRFDHKNVPITNIKLRGKRTSGSLSQAVYAEMTGRSLEEVAASKTSINRIASEMLHDNDYRQEVITTDSVNVHNQRIKVELEEVPREFWGLSFDANTNQWFARVRVNKQNTHWESSRYYDLPAAADVLRFAQQNKQDLVHVNFTIEETDKDVDVFGLLNQYDRQVQFDLDQGTFTTDIEMPSEQIISNLKKNSSRAVDQKEDREIRAWDKVVSTTDYPEPNVMPDMIADFKAKSKASIDADVERRLRKNLTAVQREIETTKRRLETGEAVPVQLERLLAIEAELLAGRPGVDPEPFRYRDAFRDGVEADWSEFIANADDSTKWDDSSIEFLLLMTKQLDNFSS